MTPFRNKRSLKKTGFEIDNEGVKYGDKHYKFDEITATRVVRHTLEHKIVGIGSDFHHSIAIGIYVKSGEELRVTEQPTWLSSSNISIVQIIENQFSIIAQKTWHNRLYKYIEQVEDTGYFEYSGWHFYPQQQVIKDLEKDKSYNIDSIILSRQPLYLKVEIKNEGIGTQILKSLGGKVVGIDTMTDTDVFFSLLNHFFNIRL